MYVKCMSNMCKINSDVSKLISSVINVHELSLKDVCSIDHTKK